MTLTACCGFLLERDFVLVYRMKIVRKQVVRKYLAAAKHLKSRHISVRLYVMLQNVVRYLVQNIVVHCVNMVRHVLCCDYLGGGRERGTRVLGSTWLLGGRCLSDTVRIALRSCCCLGWILPDSQGCLCGLVL